MKLRKRQLRPRVGKIKAETIEDLDSYQWYGVVVNVGHRFEAHKALGSTIKDNHRMLIEKAVPFEEKNWPTGFKALSVRGKFFAYIETEPLGFEKAKAKPILNRLDHFTILYDEACPEYGGNFTLDSLIERRRYSIATGTANHSGTETKVVTGKFIRENWKHKEFTFFAYKDSPPRGYVRLKIFSDRCYWVRPWDRDHDAKKQWSLVSRLRKNMPRACSTTKMFHGKFNKSGPKPKKGPIIKIKFRGKR